MALTALTGRESIRPAKEYPAKKIESPRQGESDSKVEKKREDRVDLREAIVKENLSAQKSARSGAESLLGKIDLSA